MSEYEPVEAQIKRIEAPDNRLLFYAYLQIDIHLRGAVKRGMSSAGLDDKLVSILCQELRDE